MKIETTVRKAGLLRLATFIAPGQMEFRQRLGEICDRLEQSLEGVLKQAGGELREDGGFRFRDTAFPISVCLDVEDLRHLDQAFRIAVWDPAIIKKPLERVVWGLAVEIGTWGEEAEAGEKWDSLPEDQKEKILRAEKKRKKKKSKRVEADLNGTS